MGERAAVEAGRREGQAMSDLDDFEKRFPAKKPRKRKAKAKAWDFVSGVPVSLPPPPKKKKAKSASTRPLEADVQRAILDYLKAHPKVAWAQRINSGKVRTAHGSWFSGADEGTTDIIGMLVGGRLLAPEIKRDEKQARIDAKKKPKQIVFIKMVNDNGGLAFVAWSVEMVEEMLRDV